MIQNYSQRQIFQGKRVVLQMLIYYNTDILFQKRRVLKENQMEALQSIDQPIEKKQVKKQEKEQLPNTYVHSPLIQQPQHTLSLDHNHNSLALGVRNSIENVIPIPRNMLSHSDDVEPLVEQDPDKDIVYYNSQNRIKQEAQEEEKEWFVDQLGLNELLYFKKVPSNTKNVLRNFGNAQNQYILYHKDAQAYANEKLANPQKFYKWVRGLKLQKFQNFKEIWSSDDINPVFRRVYRQLCFKFYFECAIPYVMSSRMRNENTKLSHLRYVYRFLQGIKDPYQFTYFKKTDK